MMVVVSMAFLLNRVGGDNDAFLMGGEAFSSPQLHNMEAAFAKANLNDYRIEGNRIHVSSGKQSAYMGALADAGALPPTFGRYLEKVVATNSFWADKELRRAGDQNRHPKRIAVDSQQHAGYRNRRGHVRRRRIRSVWQKPLRKRFG